MRLYDHFIFVKRCTYFRLRIIFIKAPFKMNIEEAGSGSEISYSLPGRSRISHLLVFHFRFTVSVTLLKIRYPLSATPLYKKEPAQASSFLSALLTIYEGMVYCTHKSPFKLALLPIKTGVRNHDASLFYSKTPGLFIYSLLTQFIDDFFSILDVFIG